MLEGQDITSFFTAVKARCPCRYRVCRMLFWKLCASGAASGRICARKSCLEESQTQMSNVKLSTDEQKAYLTNWKITRNAYHCPRRHRQECVRHSAVRDASERKPNKQAAICLHRYRVRRILLFLTIDLI